MKTLNHIIALIAAVTLLTACPSKNGENDSEAPTPPENLVIHWNESGGMLPVSEKIYISEDSAYWEWWHYQAETMVSWVPTGQELNDLYEILLENDFDQIKSTSEGEVYDRGGVNIDISVNDQKYQLDNSGNDFIKEQYQQSFGTISGSIQSYANEHVKKQMITVPIIVSESVKSSNYHLVVKLNNMVIYDPENINKLTDNLPLKDKEVDLYPSDNRFQTHLYYPDSTNRYGGRLEYKWADFIHKIDSTTTQIKIDLLENDKAVIEVIP